MIEAWEVVVAGNDDKVVKYLAICYSREEADLVRAAVERSKQFLGQIVVVRFLGRFRLAKE